jgi:hypothetical protein
MFFLRGRGEGMGDEWEFIKTLGHKVFLNVRFNVNYHTC